MGVRPVELRYYLGAPHYRSRIDYSDDALREAAVGLPADRGLRAAGRRDGRPGPAQGRAAGVRRGDERRPEHLGGAGRRARHDPRGQHRAGRRRRGRRPRARSPRSGPCSACSASTRSTRRGPAATTSGDLKPVVDSLVALALEQRAQARDTQGLGGGRLGPRPAQERGNSGGGHSGRAALDGRRAALMPGNSRNASKRVTSKKGAAAGSGGKNRARPQGPRQDAAGRRAAVAQGLLGHREAARQDRPQAGQGAPGRGRRGPRAQDRHARHQGHHLGSRRRPGHPGRPDAAARRPGRPVRGGPRVAPGRRSNPTKEGPELLLGRNPVVEALRAAVPGDRALRRAGHRHRRPDHRDRPDRRRPRHPDPGDQPQRARPDDRRRAAPGRRPAGAAVRVRGLRRPAGRGAGADRPAAGRARRRHRPAQRGRGDPLGGRVRRRTASS